MRQRRHVTWLVVALLAAAMSAVPTRGDNAAPQKPATATPAADDPYPGVFSDGKITVAFIRDAAGGGYRGTVGRAGQSYPLTAEIKDGVVTGSFVAGDQPFAFTAQLKAGMLLFTTSNTLFELKRTSRPPASADPLTTDSPAVAASKPQGLTLVNPVLFTGVFRNAELTLALLNANDGFTGSLQKGQNKYLVTAQVEGNELKGDFASGDASYPFVAKLTLDARTLLFSTAGRVVELQREGPPPPEAGAARFPGPRPASGGGPGPAAHALNSSLPPMVPLRDTNGMTLRRPATWTARPSATGVLIVPPGPTPGEVVHLIRRDAPAGAADDEAALLAFCDNYIAFNHPTLRRTGGLEQLNTLAGPGTIVTYTGKYETGTEVVMTLYGLRAQDSRFCLVDGANKEVAGQRRRAVRQMFASFGWGEGAVDAGVVGAWLPPGAQKDAAPDVQQRPVWAYWRFDEDGRCLIVRREAGPAGATPPATARFDEQIEDEGFWYTRDGKLSIVWSERGGQTFTYRVSDQDVGKGTLTLTAPDGGQLVFAKGR